MERKVTSSQSLWGDSRIEKKRTEKLTVAETTQGDQCKHDKWLRRYQRWVVF